MTDTTTDTTDTTETDERKPAGQMTPRQGMQALMTCLGYLEGMHTNLDLVRDGYDPQNKVDHNIEQAQIALENASMRLQQVCKILIARIEDEPEERDLSEPSHGKSIPGMCPSPESPDEAHWWDKTGDGAQSAEYFCCRWCQKRMVD